ncbi:MAG: hypothetical protein HY827_08325 [Actinobacteria bacterium]|nr:hypothetical protein [Actinomycetota bacterium]
MATVRSDDPPDHGFPADEDTPSSDRDTQRTDRDTPSPDRELTVIEMMDGPGRPTDRTRSTVLWIALAFASMLMSLTLGVIYASGLDVLELIVVVMLGAVIFVLIGALRYRGVDPMAQFEPQPIPDRRSRRKKTRQRDRGDRGESGDVADEDDQDVIDDEHDSGVASHDGDTDVDE